MMLDGVNYMSVWNVVSAPPEITKVISDLPLVSIHKAGLWELFDGNWSKGDTATSAIECRIDKRSCLKVLEIQ